MPCRIELDEQDVPLHLGCTEAERAELQPVGLGLTVEARDGFAACRTDRLADTLDAAELGRALVESARAARVQTAERLCGLLLEELGRRYPACGLRWSVSVYKRRFGYRVVQSRDQ